MDIQLGKVKISFDEKATSTTPIDYQGSDDDINQLKMILSDRPGYFGNLVDIEQTWPYEIVTVINQVFGVAIPYESVEYPDFDFDKYLP